ncbi:hypothetical protein SDC9_174734 [bioreactor metagenome]|uniref:Uncharacterized protein n=1 Tax=bioreactor metagenome TaxID=1076179 RepID=A0A645GUI1_9ZZZZ
MQRAVGTLADGGVGIFAVAAAFGIIAHAPAVTHLEVALPGPAQAVVGRQGQRHGRTRCAPEGAALAGRSLCRCCRAVAQLVIQRLAPLRGIGGAAGVEDHGQTPVGQAQGLDG